MLTDLQRELLHIAGNNVGYFLMAWYIVRQIGLMLARTGGSAKAEANVKMSMDAKPDAKAAEEKGSDR